MSSFSKVVGSGFDSTFSGLRARVNTLAEGLSSDEFWTKPFAFGNSFGHLTLHVTGNLNHFIGALIGESGYVRDRDREFTDAHRPTPEAVLANLDDAVERVRRILATQSDVDFVAPYAAPGLEGVADRFSVFLLCAAHFREHVGQMIYIANEVRRRRASSSDA